MKLIFYQYTKEETITMREKGAILNIALLMILIYLLGDKYIMKSKKIYFKVTEPLSAKAQHHKLKGT